MGDGSIGAVACCLYYVCLPCTAPIPLPLPTHPREETGRLSGGGERMGRMASCYGVVFVTWLKWLFAASSGLRAQQHQALRDPRGLIGPRRLDRARAGLPRPASRANSELVKTPSDLFLHAQEFPACLFEPSILLASAFDSPPSTCPPSPLLPVALEPSRCAPRPSEDSNRREEIKTFWPARNKSRLASQSLTQPAAPTPTQPSGHFLRTRPTPSQPTAVSANPNPFQFQFPIPIPCSPPRLFARLLCTPSASLPSASSASAQFLVCPPFPSVGGAL